MKTVGAYRRDDAPYVVLCNASPPIFRRARPARATRSKVSLAVTIIPTIVGGIDARVIDVGDRRRYRFDGAAESPFVFNARTLRDL